MEVEKWASRNTAKNGLVRYFCIFEDCCHSRDTILVTGSIAAYL